MKNMMNDEFWHDLQNEQKWRAAARQAVRLNIIGGMSPFEAIVEVIRQCRPQRAVLEELRDMATEAY